MKKLYNSRYLFVDMFIVVGIVLLYYMNIFLIYKVVLKKRLSDIKHVHLADIIYKLKIFFLIIKLNQNKIKVLKSINQAVR